MLIPGKNPVEKDRHMTPPCIAKVITDLLPLSGRVLEPGRGTGAFYNAFPDSCEKLWCEIDEGRDFFQFNDEVDWVVTNPPFSIFFDFLKHSVSIAENIVFYCTINHAIALRARNRFMREHGFGVVSVVTTNTPPWPWPQSGFQVGMVHWQRAYKGTQQNGHIEHAFPPAQKAPRRLRLRTSLAVKPEQDLVALHQSAQTNGISEVFTEISKERCLQLAELGEPYTIGAGTGADD